MNLASNNKFVQVFQVIVSVVHSLHKKLLSLKIADFLQKFYAAKIWSHTVSNEKMNLWTSMPTECPPPNYLFVIFFKVWSFNTRVK